MKKGLFLRGREIQDLANQMSLLRQPVKRLTICCHQVSSGPRVGRTSRQTHSQRYGEV
jgi:hypothetical protein